MKVLHPRNLPTRIPCDSVKLTRTKPEFALQTPQMQKVSI